jgi:hypothetical protein
MLKMLKVLFLSFWAAVFFLTTLSLAYHHHDLNFTYSTCSICKAKGSLSNSAKTNLDKPFQMAVYSSLTPSFLLAAVGNVSVNKISIYVTLKSHPFSNKSPPSQS